MEMLGTETPSLSRYSHPGLANCPGKPLSGVLQGSDVLSPAINVGRDGSNDSEDDDLPILSHRRKANKTIHWSDNQQPEDASSPYCLSASKAATKSSPGPSTTKRKIVIDSEDESSDGTVEVKEAELPLSPTPQTGRLVSDAIVLSDDDDNDDDDGDDDDDKDSSQDIRPVKRRRRSWKPSSPGGSDKIETETDNEDVEQIVATTPPAKQPSPESRVAGSRSARKSARSVRQRHMELLRLRRQRRGGNLTEIDLASASSDEETRVALYDTDPEHAALSEFEDEEAEEADDSKPSEVTKLKRKGKEKEKQKGKDRRREEPVEAELVLDHDSDDSYGQSPLQEEEGSAEDMDDFIDDSHVGLIGEPDEDMLRREMPLQFTSQSRQPLKRHFKDAIEWLVHRRIDRGGAQNDDEIYRLAWDRLDRELGGLAQSRFISSSWTPAFRGALQARPYMDSFDLRSGILEEDMCHACGRSNHPASFMVMFGGPAYDLNTLDDVEGGGDGDGDGDDDDEDGEDGEDREKGNEDDEPLDMHGNPIASASQRWYVGGVCHSNAETAHDLLHWRRALKDWVEEKLAADKMLEPERIKERDEMKPRRRQALVHSMVDEWETDGTISSLYGEFVKMLEGARAKSTKTTYTRFGRFGR